MHLEELTCHSYVQLLLRKAEILTEVVVVLIAEELAIHPPQILVEIKAEVLTLLLGIQAEIKMEVLAAHQAVLPHRPLI